MGSAALYHLARMGWSDAVLLERDELTSGSTWHAAGLIGRFIGSLNMAKVHFEAPKLYATLEEDTGQATGWHGCGSVRLATNQDEADWFNYVEGSLKLIGAECHLIGPDEIKKLNPLLDLDGVLMGAYTPYDGHTDPTSSTNAMAIGARRAGVEINRYTLVTDIKARPNGEWEVITDKGNIVAEHVVNAAGCFCDQVQQMVGQRLPIVNLIHQYLVTENVPEIEALDKEVPVVRDPRASCYYRQEQKGILIGPYEMENAQAWGLDGIDWSFDMELLPPDLDRISTSLEHAMHRIPCFETAGIKRVVNGPITHLPDGNFLLGPAPGLRNYWMCCGASIGITQGAGAGKYLAQWMVHGTAEISMRGFDPRRFGAWADRDYAHARSRENYMTRLSLAFPQDQYETCRNVRRSGAHGHTEALGAITEEAGGWERPRLYAPGDWQGREPRTWRRGPSHEVARAEARAVHAGVGLGDFSGFSKFEISGPEAETYLDRLCANRIPKKHGGTCLTLLLNRQGTIEGEATIARLGPERFWFVTGAPSERRVWDWITLHARGSEDVTVTNRSEDIGILSVAGPRARAVLGACTRADLSNAAFGWLQAREIEVAGIPVIALRLSFSGELAWELHAPNDRLGALWDALWAAGRPHGIVPFGSKALDMMRMEKAYRGGHELTSDASPVHTGQMRFVRLDKDFIGRDAVARRARQGEESAIAYLEIEAGDVDVLGGEAVFRDGRLVGSVSSGNTGATTGKSLAFAFVEPEAARPGTRLEVSILGELRPASVLGEPVLDPDNRRLKSDEDAHEPT